MTLELYSKIVHKVACRFCKRNIGMYCLTANKTYAYKPHTVRVRDYSLTINKTTLKARKSHRIISDWFLGVN